ncbi:MAG: RluA family pseudouridine synthase [Bacilli bacterium]
MFKIIVSAPETTTARLDRYLAAKLPDFSRSRIDALIKAGAVTVNGQTVKSSYAPRRNDEIIISVPEATEDLRPGAEVTFTVIHEDDDIIVVDKPVGLVTHPAPGHHDDTLVNGLLARYPSLSGISGIKRPGIVHRIDKDTSGLLVIARNDKAHRYLADQLVDHAMHREYYALVKGTIEENEGVIDAPIGRDPKRRQQMAVTPYHSKDAETHFQVLKRYAGYTLLSVALKTGRTHQIRVHLAYIRHPIVGDIVYGGHDPLYSKGQLLHAYRLTLRHPGTNKITSYEARIPDHFQVILDRLNQG